MLRKSNHSITWSIFMIETWCKLHFAKNWSSEVWVFLGDTDQGWSLNQGSGPFSKSPMPVQTRGCTVRILNLISQLVDVMTVWKLGISAPWGCFGHTNSCFKSMQICETGAQRATKNWHWAYFRLVSCGKSGDESTNNQEMHIWYPNRKTVKLTDLHKFGIGQKACCPAISPFQTTHFISKKHELSSRQISVRLVSRYPIVCWKVTKKRCLLVIRGLSWNLCWLTSGRWGMGKATTTVFFCCLSMFTYVNLVFTIQFIPILDLVI